MGSSSQCLAGGCEGDEKTKTLPQSLIVVFLRRWIRCAVRRAFQQLLFVPVTAACLYDGMQHWSDGGMHHAHAWVHVEVQHGLRAAVRDITVLTTAISCDCTDIALIRLRFSTLRAEDTVYFFPLSCRHTGVGACQCQWCPGRTLHDACCRRRPAKNRGETE